MRDAVGMEESPSLPIYISAERHTCLMGGWRAHGPRMTRVGLCGICGFSQKSDNDTIFLLFMFSLFNGGEKVARGGGGDPIYLD